MKGDFSRITFDPRKHYSRVLMQQGRVQIDADWNEQVAIILHRLETMAKDLIGPLGGGPRDNCGFVIERIEGEGNDFKISQGRYYVEGLLCENDHNNLTFHKQLRGEDDVKFEIGKDYLVYLDAWEQYVNVIEDPNIREKALGGPDSAGRSRIVWSVRAMDLAQIPGFVMAPQPCIGIKDENMWKKIFPVIQPPNRGMLAVMTEQPSHDSDSPCIVSPASRYRGMENQLYRVEIHSGGNAPLSGEKSNRNDATFKWSRENGSVIFPVAAVRDQQILLDPLSLHSTIKLKAKDWVELIDDDQIALAQPGELLQIMSLGQTELELNVNGVIKPVESKKHPYLRRWEGSTKIVEGRLLTLEDGIQIRFEPCEPKNQYRPGDFWYIPARTADNGIILWPKPVPPDGITHRYAPLGTVKKEVGEKLTVTQCAMKFDPVVGTP